MHPLQLGEEAGCGDETGQVIGEDGGLERRGHGRFFSSCAVEPEDRDRKRFLEAFDKFRRISKL